MFSSKDIDSIDKEYFEVKEASYGCIVLQSRNTGHLWCVTGSGIGNGVTLRHKHKWADTWHPQSFYMKGRHNLAGAIKAIQAHDEFIALAQNPIF